MNYTCREFSKLVKETFNQVIIKAGYNKHYLNNCHFSNKINHYTRKLTFKTVGDVTDQNIINIWNKIKEEVIDQIDPNWTVTIEKSWIGLYKYYFVNPRSQRQKSIEIGLSTWLEPK